MEKYTENSAAPGRERFQRQLAFLLEADREKEIVRQTYLADGSRKENDAEHAWHLALFAMVLKEYANTEIDLLKVISMVLIHDVVEIDAGDTYAYDTEGQKTAEERERKAAERLFGLLPEDQGSAFKELWEEFEAWESPEARFAHTLDNFQPFLLNVAGDGRSWLEHGVHVQSVLKRNERTASGSGTVWAYMKELIERNLAEGKLKP